MYDIILLLYVMNGYNILYIDNIYLLMILTIMLLQNWYLIIMIRISAGNLATSNYKQIEELTKVITEYATKKDVEQEYEHSYQRRHVP